MKKHVLSALLLAGALLIAPLGNFSFVVATASSNTVSDNDSTGDAEEDVVQISATIPVEIQNSISFARADVNELDVVPGSTVTLNVEGPVQRADLGNRVNVQLEIYLTGVRDSHNLSHPVRVTVSVPAGLQANNMHILHYANGVNAAPENVPFVVNSDGSITFSVSSFSVFAFVEGQYVAPSDDDDADDDDDEDDSSDDSQSTEAAPAQGVKDSVPKTGDSNVPVLPFAVAGVACAVAACALMKKEQA